ncbi:hypothetical protein B0T24DRAFT_668814 [Lasiosphaeria ovina]|uniref:Uncharacterized protein n=1 Tax=Lasiosphaeria ovina TaxID=92902 RepID=A0AAE0K4K1_9PEZI|nr:hypothetical protein B0T24DRAFT_668814 [Lasiosphaeria ovina]
MDFIHRKPQTWPYAANSAGRARGTLNISRIGRVEVCEATGPAREDFVRASQEIIAYLNDNSGNLHDSASIVGLSLFMMGKSVARMKPVIMFVSEDKKARVEAYRMIKKSTILDGYPGFGLGEMELKAEFENLLPLASSPPSPASSLIVETASTSFITPLELAEVFTSSADSLNGSRLEASLGGEPMTRPSTAVGGGIVSFNGALMLHSVGHFLRQAQPSRDIGVQQFSPSPDASDDECEVTGLSDSDDDDDGDLIEIASLSSSAGSERSITPILLHGAYPNQDSDLSALQSRLETLEVSSRQLPLTSGSKVLLGIGEVALISALLDSSLTEIDISAVEAAGVDVSELRSTAIPLESYLEHVETAPSDTGITALTPSGAIGGMLSGTPSFARLPGSKMFSQVYTAKLDRPLLPGDCGSWVRNAVTKKLFGHVIAGSTTTGLVLLMPAANVFSQALEALSSQETTTSTDETKWESTAVVSVPSLEDSNRDFGFSDDSLEVLTEKLNDMWERQRETSKANGSIAVGTIANIYTAMAAGARGYNETPDKHLIESLRSETFHLKEAAAELDTKVSRLKVEILVLEQEIGRLKKREDDYLACVDMLENTKRRQAMMSSNLDKELRELEMAVDKTSRLIEKTNEASRQLQEVAKASRQIEKADEANRRMQRLQNAAYQDTTTKMDQHYRDMERKMTEYRDCLLERKMRKVNPNFNEEEQYQIRFAVAVSLVINSGSDEVDISTAPYVRTPSPLYDDLEISRNAGTLGMGWTPYTDYYYIQNMPTPRWGPNEPTPPPPSPEPSNKRKRSDDDLDEDELAAPSPKRACYSPPVSPVAGNNTPDDNNNNNDPPADDDSSEGGNRTARQKSLFKREMAELKDMVKSMGDVIQQQGERAAASMEELRDLVAEPERRIHDTLDNIAGRHDAHLDYLAREIDRRPPTWVVEDMLREQEQRITAAVEARFGDAIGRLEATLTAALARRDGEQNNAGGLVGQVGGGNIGAGSNFGPGYPPHFGMYPGFATPWGGYPPMPINYPAGFAPFPRPCRRNSNA